MLPKPPQAAYQINRNRLSCKCIQHQANRTNTDCSHWL